MKDWKSLQRLNRKIPTRQFEFKFDWFLGIREVLLYVIHNLITLPGVYDIEASLYPIHRVVHNHADWYWNIPANHLTSPFLCWMASMVADKNQWKNQWEIHYQTSKVSDAKVTVISFQTIIKIKNVVLEWPDGGLGSRHRGGIMLAGGACLGTRPPPDLDGLDLYDGHCYTGSGLGRVQVNPPPPASRKFIQ